MNSELAKLSLDELKKRLAKIEEEYEEFEEERTYTLKLAGVHVPGATVKKFESEKENYLKQIAELKEAIKAKEASA